jgi:hypothetical protein
MIFITLNDESIDHHLEPKSIQSNTDPPPHNRSRAPRAASQTPVRHQSNTVPCTISTTLTRPILIAMRELWGAAEQEMWLHP